MHFFLNPEYTLNTLKTNFSKTAMATYLNNANVNITTLANNRRDFNGGDNGNDTGCINYGSFNQQHQPQQQQHHQQQQQKNTKGNIVGKSDSKQIISANVTSVPKFTHCINHGHRTTGVQQQARPVSQHLIKTESTNINENILIPLANTNTVSHNIVWNRLNCINPIILIQIESSIDH